ncbi:cell division protein PerM [Schaalia sp. lx-100]|uniref:cell division protein PerM n=1 Tax=Schaalia sp. lx-100 TaxID=2899081 RepID=UPI001E4F189D|nr:DUF6350 family protein [Schaalia sp. lx-100]MCD4557236.1 7TM-DISM domain-containing protein [Schaalia sp. lx-100]
MSETKTIEAQARPVIHIRLPDGWARAMLSGVQAALVSWGLVIVMVMATYWSIAANPWLKSATWSDAFATGGDLWGLVLGGTLNMSGTHIRVIPTLICLIVLLFLRAFLISSRRFPAISQWWAVIGFALTSCALAAGTSDHLQWHTTIVGSLILPIIAVIWSLLSSSVNKHVQIRIPDWVKHGLRLGVLAALGAAGVGFMSLICAVWAAWDRIVHIHELFFISSTYDTVMTVMAQLMFMPTAIVWAVSWLTGAGFYVGADALHSPTSTPVAPIPVVPLLGALPAQTTGAWVIVFLIAAGCAYGIYVRMRACEPSIRAQAGSLLTMSVTLWLLSVGVAGASRMHIGSERMSILGPDIWRAPSLLVLAMCGAITVCVLIAHPATVGWARTQCQRMRAEYRDARDTSVLAEAALVDPLDSAEVNPEEPSADFTENTHESAKENSEDEKDSTEQEKHSKPALTEASHMQKQQGKPAGVTENSEVSEPGPQEVSQSRPGDDPRVENSSSTEIKTEDS